MTAPAGPSRPDVLIIGGGPAGLAAARRLAPKVAGDVVVLERDDRTGGIPRHSDHHGYGLTEYRRSLRGPDYARRLTDDALAAGAVLRTRTMVTGWTPSGGAVVTSPQGVEVIEPRVTVLATGARERPRSARLIPGDRPGGVLTTGQLQNQVHLQHRQVGRRAVVLGAELVSWSAVLTLRHAGCATALMVTPYRRPEAPSGLVGVGGLALRVPLACEHRVARVIGRSRLEAVELEHLPSGARWIQPCDTLVTTGDWIPDHELARMGGLGIDPASLAPLVDTGLRTTEAGVFAIGNLVHPVDTAAAAAADGAHVVGPVIEYLQSGGRGREGVRVVRLSAEPPLRWVAPGLVREGDAPPARNRYLAWPSEHVPHPEVVARQAGRLVGRRRVPWPASPGRVFRIPARVLAGIRPGDGDVTVTLA